MSTPNFGELRSLLEREPSAASFDLMIQRLEAAARDDEGRTRAEWLPYIEDRLEQWPDIARLCPKHRLEDYEAGELIWCHLVRALDYEGVSLGKKRLEQVLAAPNVDLVTHLDIRSANLKWDQIATLATEATFKLKSFGFRRSSKIDGDVLDALFGSEMLSEVTDLNLRGWDKLPASVCSHFVEHFPLQNLRSLNVTGGVFSARTFKTMLETGKLDQLEVFRSGAWVLDKNSSGFMGLIAKRKTMKNLRTLHINEAKPKEIAALVKATHLSTLRELRIDNWLDAETALALLDAPHLSELETLQVGLEEEGSATFLRGLATSPLFTSLTSLHLTGFNDEPSKDMIEALRALLESGALANLTRLAIPINSASELDTLTHHSESLANLQQLMLIVYADDHNTTMEASAAQFFGKAHLPNLEELLIDSFDHLSAFLNILRDSPCLKRIKKLKLISGGESGRTSFNAHMTHFLSSPHLTGLTTLDLTTDISHNAREFMPGIVAAPHLDAIESIVVGNHVYVPYAREELMNSPYHPEFLHVGHLEHPFFQQLEWL